MATVDTATTARPRHRARLHSVFERSLHDTRRSVIGWSIGMASLAGITLAFFPTIRDNPDLKDLIESYPEAIRELMAIHDYTTGPGYLQAEAFSFMVPLLLLMVGLLYGSDATAGEEERGSLDLLLAHPVTRRRVVLEKAAAMVTDLAVITAVLLGVLLVGGPMVGLDVAVGRLVAVCVASWLLALDTGALALFLGAATGRRGPARGVAAAVSVGGYLVSGLAALVSGLKPLRPLSMYEHALGREPLFTGFAWAHLGVLVGVGVVLVAGAVVAFDRRDLAV